MSTSVYISSGFLCVSSRKEASLSTPLSLSVHLLAVLLLHYVNTILHHQALAHFNPISREEITRPLQSHRHYCNLLQCRRTQLPFVGVKWVWKLSSTWLFMTLLALGDHRHCDCFNYDAWLCLFVWKWTYFSWPTEHTMYSRFSGLDRRLRDKQSWGLKQNNDVGQNLANPLRRPCGETC